MYAAPAPIIRRVTTDQPERPAGTAVPPGAGLPGDGDPAVPEPPVPHADAVTAADVAELEHELRETRPVAIGALLAATGLLRIGGYGASVVIQLELLRHINAAPAVIGAVGGVGSLTELVFAPPLARWADRLGRSRFLIAGPVCGTVAALIATFVANSAGFASVRLLEGIGAAAFVPTALGTIAAATSHSRTVRASASGAFEAATLGGIALGFATGGISWHYLHQGAFFILAGCYFAAALVCMRFVPRVPPLPVSPVSVIVRAVTGPGPIRTFLPAWMGTFALLGAFYANLTALLARRQSNAPVPGQALMHHFDERVVSLLLVSWLVLLVVGIALWTPWLPRLGSAVVMRRAAPGAWLLAGGLLIANHLSPDLIWVAFPPAIVGILWLAGFGPAAVAYLAECSETFAADRSALMAFYTVTLAAGGVIGSILGGVAIGLGGADGLFLLGIGFTTFTYLTLGPVVRYERALLAEVGAEDEPLPADAL